MFLGVIVLIKSIISSLLILSISSAAHSFTLLKADAFDCIKEVIPASGLPKGIVTDYLESGIFVKTCEGEFASVRLQNGEVSLVEATSNIPSRQLTGEKTALSDSEVSSSNSIRAAWLTGSTDRYPHAILGDGIEASGLAVIDRSGKRYNLELDKNSVFEDRKVRIADLDKDGQEELIVVRSYLNSGAALAIYGIRGNQLVNITETPAIGTPNRWLNPAIVADVDNDGELEIAYVQTPHIGGILHVLAFRNDKLVYKYKSTQTSNHGIGSRIQELTAAIDWNGDGISDIAVPAAGHSAIKIYSYAQGKPQEIANIDLGDKILSAIVASDLNKNKKPELVFALSNGDLVVLTP